MTLAFSFDNSYARLPERFFAKLPPVPVSKPGPVAINGDLAKELGLDAEALRAPEGLSVLAGNKVPEGAEPLAQAYAGHQFGGFTPQLGDGRAILLGEILSESGERFDIQLKGSGRTPFSRMGDGRAWLGPVMREYIVSEAMHAFGVPTTRALAAVTTGDIVVREVALPGAVLTRVASSHIRVGTFQYFAARQDFEALRALTNYVIERHYRDAETPLDLLNAVIDRQAELVARWMGLGFIHGVMNTDNTTISGQTIDYGPCAFMDAYEPGKVYSSIDQFGRYAYGRQPEILVWNLAQFATSLLSLMGDDRNAAIESATEAVHRFPDMYSAAWLRVFSAKLGLETSEAGDASLIKDLLEGMAQRRMDFTNTFRSLGTSDAADHLASWDGYCDWSNRWRERLRNEGSTPELRRDRIVAANPAIIPRNHRIEEAIQAGISGDFEPFHRLNAGLYAPFGDSPEFDDLRRPPHPEEEVTQTFCGT